MRAKQLTAFHRVWILASACLAAVAIPAPAMPAADEPVTFLAASDTHYGDDDARNEGQRKVLAAMNTIAGKRFPDAVGGAVIDTPRGVLVAGDLVNGGTEARAKSQWPLWTRDFGLGGTDGLLKYTVYETWGNHDNSLTVQNGIVARNQARLAKGLVKSVSPDYGGTKGINCSWDWGPLHLVTTGFYPADSNDSTAHRGGIYDPRESLKFLVDDLGKSVGDRGRPVVVMSHANLPNDSNEWWTAAQRDAFRAAINPYNVVVIVSGHEAGGHKTWQGIDVLGCNGLGSGFWVVQIEGMRLTAARTIDGERWAGGASAPFTRDIAAVSGPQPKEQAQPQ